MWCSNKTDHPTGPSNAHTQIECLFTSNTFQDRVPPSSGQFEHLADGLRPARCHHVSRAKHLSKFKALLPLFSPAMALRLSLNLWGHIDAAPVQDCPTGRRKVLAARIADVGRSQYRSFY